jgi:predicted dehydrogenase
MTRSMQFALVGCGGVGKVHADAYREWERAELVAYADPRGEARKEMAELVPAARAYSDYPRLLAENDLDLVAIATRAGLHHAITPAAARAGVRAILCEKPMALDLAQAEEMIEVGEAANVHLCISHQRRYDRQHVGAKDAIRGGEIGEPRWLEVHWPFPSGWMADHRQSTDAGGVVTCVGVYVFDLLHFCLGRTQRVSARVGRKAADRDIEDTLVAMLELEGCVPVYVEMGEYCADLTKAEPNAQALRFFVHGTDAVITFGDFEWYPWLRRAGKSGWTELTQPWPDWSGFKLLHNAIYDVLEKGGATLCDAREALPAHEVCMACYASERSGREVVLPLDTKHSPLAVMNMERKPEDWLTPDLTGG